MTYTGTSSTHLQNLKSQNLEIYDFHSTATSYWICTDVQFPASGLDFLQSTKQMRLICTAAISTPTLHANWQNISELKLSCNIAWQYWCLCIEKTLRLSFQFYFEIECKPTINPPHPPLVCGIFFWSLGFEAGQILIGSDTESMDMQ